MPNSKETIKKFGYQENQTKEKNAIARISSCYDLLNELIIQPIIRPYKCSELEMLKEHLKKLKKGDLLLLDRGYGANWLFYLLTKKEIDFVARINTNLFLDFWSGAKESEVLELSKVSTRSQKRIRKSRLKFKPFKLRLLKISLKTGETEVLITSLLDEVRYPTSLFEQLYSQRPFYSKCPCLWKSV